jgi:hypothetical protein
MFVLGALVGTAADQVHVRGQVLSYPRPYLAGEAWWVPLLFGAAGVVLPLGNAALLSRSRGAPSSSSARTVATSWLWFMGAYVSTVLFQGAPLLLAVALVIAWAVRLAARPAPDKLIAGVAFALAGAAFESALSSTGAFSYRHPDLFLVPAWLPALYLHASLMTREASLAILPRARPPGQRAPAPAATSGPSSPSRPGSRW